MFITSEVVLAKSAGAGVECHYAGIGLREMGSGVVHVPARREIPADRESEEHAEA